MSKLKVPKSYCGASIEHFKLGRLIGKGGFAEVFEATCVNLYEDADTEYAIKKIRKKKDNAERISTEIKIHSMFTTFPPFVKLHTSFEDEKFCYLVLELCKRGSLDDYVKRHGPQTELEAIKLIKQVINAVRHLQKNLIIHRDLSLKNLLLTEDHQVKVADFGLAVKLNDANDKTNTVLGTANFMSPEVCNNETYDIMYDLWGVGCALYNLLYGKPPFDAKTREEIMRKVMYSPLEFPDYATDEAKELLKAMLHKNKKERIQINDILKHSFFQKYEKSETMNKSNGTKSFDSRSRSSSVTRLQNQSNCRKSCCDSHSRASSCSGIKKSRNTNKSSAENDFEPKHQDRHESQYETPIKERPERYVYPVEMQNLSNQNFSHQISHNDYSSTNSKCLSNSKRIYVMEECSKNRYESECESPIKEHSEYFVHVDKQQKLGNENFSRQTSLSDYCSANSKSLSNSKRTSAKQQYSKNRDESECETPIKEHLVHPVELQNFANQNLSSQICNSDHGYSSSKSRSDSKRTSAKQCSKNRCVKDFNPMKDSPCNNDKCSTPDKLPNQSSSLVNSTTKSKQHMDVKHTVKRLEDKMDPLNTERLCSCRHQCGSNKGKEPLMFSILTNGDVCLEYYKESKSEKIVKSIYRIRKDGLEITVCKPKGKVFLNPDQPQILEDCHETQCFSFKDLPAKHWRAYRYAKFLVYKVKCRAPKITIFEKQAKCMMMENSPNPNFEMHYYNGYEIREHESEITIKNKDGYIIAKNNDTEFMLEEFEAMKKRCIDLEKHNNSFYPNFPIIYGRKPTANNGLKMQDDNKENVSRTCFESPSFSGLNSGVRQHEITISRDNSLQGISYSSVMNTPYSRMTSAKEKSTNTSSSKSKAQKFSYLKNLKEVIR